MIFISHRGNLKGKDIDNENNPVHIYDIITQNKLDVEIDLWVIDNQCYLGHDKGQYAIEKEWLYLPGLWVHCKNLEALSYMKKINIEIPYFYHENDSYTLVSNGMIWTYPGTININEDCIIVSNVMQKDAGGICADNIMEFYEN